MGGTLASHVDTHLFCRQGSPLAPLPLSHFRPLFGVAGATLAAPCLLQQK